MMKHRPPSGSLPGQLIFNTLGDGLAAGLGFLTIVFVSRNLSVGGFGRFTVALAVLVVASGFSGFGTTTAMVRFVSGYIRGGDIAEADQTAWISLIFRVAVSCMLAALLFVVADPLSEGFFRNPELAPLLTFAGTGFVAVSAFGCVKSVLHAHQRFARSVALQILVDVAKLSAVVGLLLSARLEVSSAVAVFALAPSVGALVGVFWLSRPAEINLHAAWRRLRALLAYGRWVFASQVCVTTYKYVGLLLLARMLTDHDVGIYGLALNITYAFAILINSLHSVLLPRVSTFTQRDEFTRYLRGSLRTAALLGAVAAASLFLAYPVVPVLFGARYAESVPILIWLGLGSIVQTGAVTLRVVAYSLNKPQILTLIDIGQLVCMVVGCLLLIPTMGAFAPAIISLALNVIAFGGLLIYVSRRLTGSAFTLAPDSVPAASAGLS